MWDICKEFWSFENFSSTNFKMGQNFVLCKKSGSQIWVFWIFTNLFKNLLYDEPDCNFPALSPILSESAIISFHQSNSIFSFLFFPFSLFPSQATSFHLCYFFYFFLFSPFCVFDQKPARTFLHLFLFCIFPFVFYVFFLFYIFKNLLPLICLLNTHNCPF